MTERRLQGNLVYTCVDQSDLDNALAEIGGNSRFSNVVVDGFTITCDFDSQVE